MSIFAIAGNVHRDLAIFLVLVEKSVMDARVAGPGRESSYQHADRLFLVVSTAGAAGCRVTGDGRVTGTTVGWTARWWSSCTAGSAGR